VREARYLPHFLILFFLFGDPPFDQVKDKIAHYESLDGRLKIHVNKNGTIDCGRYQINSRHFVERDRVGLAFDSIFVSFGVGVSLHDRVAHAITNDSLNEALARKIYEIKGLKAWVSSRKFIK
jgi:hypothetical protein